MNMKRIILITFVLLINNISHSQWIQQSSGVTSALQRTRFINQNTGWCCGNASVILKTTNGGINWFSQNSGTTGRILTDIFPVNDSIIYVVGYFDTILKSTNGGTNWIIIANGQSSHSYNCCFFINEKTGWIGTSAPGTRKTTDGGNTFIEQFVNEIPDDFYFKDSLNGNFSGGASVVKTSNGGENWTITTIETPGIGLEEFDRISFVNDLTGFVVGDRGTVHKTTNFGTTWDSVGQITDVAETMYCSKFINDSVGYAGGNFDRLFKTSSGGKFWTRQNFTGNPYDIYTYSDSVVWLCGNGGIIFHTTSGGQTGINTISQNIPESFELYQNYPNPFNPFTKIKFSIKYSGSYNLEIYNSLGQLSGTLFSKQLNPGEYEYNFDGSRLTTGIFFYRLSSENFSQTKKMILIK